MSDLNKDFVRAYVDYVLLMTLWGAHWMTPAQARNLAGTRNWKVF